MEAVNHGSSPLHSKNGMESDSRRDIFALPEYIGRMHRIFRFSGCLAIGTFVFVTLAPAGLRPISGRPVNLE